jgi:hypothetical protein
MGTICFLFDVLKVEAAPLSSITPSKTHRFGRVDFTGLRRNVSRHC